MRRSRRPAVFPALLGCLLLAAAATAGCGENGGPPALPMDGGPAALAERMEQAKGFLSRGEGEPAREAFRALVGDFPGSAEARFGMVLAHELLLVEALDDLISLLLDAAVHPDSRGAGAPIDAGAVLLDVLENRLEPTVRDALEQLAILDGAPSLALGLDRLPYRILETEFLVLSGEYDAGDILLHTAGFHLAAAALNTVLSWNLDFDFRIVQDHAARWPGMESMAMIRDAADMLLEIFLDPQHPDFLRLRTEGLVRMPRAALEMAAFLEYRELAFRAIREEPIRGERQVTGCNDRDGDGACDPGEFLHGFLWSLPAEMQEILTPLREALAASFLDGAEADPDPDMPAPPRSAAPRSPPDGPPGGPPAPGWETVFDVAALPYLVPGARTLQVSSHDPLGGNDDGFTPPNELYQDERGEFVLFDGFGPGCIYRMWFTHTWSLVANLRLYVDDMERPVVEGPFLLLFASVFEPFAAPLVGNWISGSGGCFSYLPIPFEARCKVTSNLPPEFFQFTWVRYDADTPVRSVTGTEDVSRLCNQWRRTGEDPKGDLAGPPASAGKALLRPGSREVLLDRAGAGAVWSLRLDVTPFRQETVEGLWLVARWDGHAEPDVEAPVNEFFGSYYAEETAAGLLLGRSDRGLYCYLPMPFWTRGEVVLEHRGIEPAAVSWELRVTGEAYGAGAGYFRALHRAEDPVAVGRDYRIAERTGRAGKWLGLTHTLRGPLSRWYLEGDERFHVDGSASPAVHGTGTEDYYNGGWYFLMGPFAEPLFGNPWHRVLPDRDETGAFRLHLGDAVHYLSGVRLGIEHGADSLGASDRYSSVAYFYELDAPLSRLTDTLDAGNGADEAAHGYQAPGSAATEEIVSFYEGEDDGTPVADAGRVVAGESRFRVALDPGNAGAILRRRYDQQAGGQRAEVRVDGRPAGTWHTPESSPALRWAEDDFVLPASLTAGRDEVEITLRPVGPAAWTEYFYWVHSILPAPAVQARDDAE